MTDALLTQPWVRIDFKLTIEGQREPELEGYQRARLLEGESLEDFSERFMTQQCREHHVRKVWKLA